LEAYQIFPPILDTIWTGYTIHIKGHLQLN